MEYDYLCEVCETPVYEDWGVGECKGCGATYTSEDARVHELYLNNV